MNRNNKFNQRLMEWYDCSARSLPWRDNPLPYRVLVSEIMLQQTRVDTVIPYFLRFMEALPDVYSLAAAEEETLLKLWQGLGYYSRVRNLQKAARVVVENFNGQLPSQPKLLATLPGIGEYTAAAIASIAYGVALPSIDGNLLRVLSRLEASREDITLPATKKKLTALAKELMPLNRPGDFNQAMMDLGATICLPNGAPACSICPVSEFCVAYQTDSALQYPVKSPKKARRIVERTVFILRVDHRVLLQKRPSKGLLGGLPELPGAEEFLDPSNALTQLKNWGLHPIDVKPLNDAVHIFTHVEWHMKAYLATLAESEALPDRFILASLEDLETRFALPSAFQAYFQFLP